MTPEEIVHEIIVSPRRSYFAFPDLRVIERPGWLRLMTPSFTQGGFNEVVHARLSSEEADEIIDRTIVEYRDLGIRFRWSVGPEEAPSDLGERLARRGLVAQRMRGMARSTAGYEVIGDAQPLRVCEIAELGARGARIYSETVCRGWGVDPEPFVRIHEHLVASSGERRRNFLFVAFVDDTPAGSAAYVAFARSAYLLAGVVLPEHRERGVYRALVGARLRHAAARGIALATTRASEATSAPRLEHMGFSGAVPFTVYSG